MNNPCSPCWQNCGVEADAEMLAIDAMEDAIAPLDEQTTRIRELITRYGELYPSLTPKDHRFTPVPCS